MIISDGTLQSLLEKGEIVCTPLSDNALQPASIDCCLGDHFLWPDTAVMDVIDMEKTTSYQEVRSQSILVPAKSFVLATTREFFKIPSHISAFVEGRSSVGRMGLFVQNAGWVDPGFEGCITLELYNAADIPIRLCAGRRICQMVFCYVDKQVLFPYRGKYQGQTLAVGSLICHDSDNLSI